MEQTFSIPIIKDSKLYKKIAELSKHDFLKVIELGVIAFENTNYQQYRWENHDFNERFEKMKQDHNTAIRELKEKYNKEINEKNELLSEKTRFFESKKKEMYKEIKMNIEIQFKESIDFKNNQLKDLQKELSEKKQKENDSFKKWTECERFRQEKLQAQHKKDMEELRDKYEEKLDKLNKIVQDMHMVKGNSSLKGQVGENKMLNILTMLFPKYEIEDTHSTPNRGDFIIHLQEDKKILIDNKDYKNNVPKKEIDKFYQDMETNADVHGGILMSNTCGIAKKDDFNIEIVSGKPIIYLHHTNNNNWKIQSAIDMISSIIQSKDVDFSNVEISKKIKDYASTIKRKIAKIRRDLKKHEETMISTILDIENTLKNVFITTNTKY